MKNAALIKNVKNCAVLCKCCNKLVPLEGIVEDREYPNCWLSICKNCHGATKNKRRKKCIKKI